MPLELGHSWVDVVTTACLHQDVYCYTIMQSQYDSLSKIKCKKIGTRERSPQNIGKHSRLHTCAHAHTHTQNSQNFTPTAFVTQAWVIFEFCICFNTILENNAGKIPNEEQDCFHTEAPIRFLQLHLLYNVIINCRSIIVSLALHKHVFSETLWIYVPSNFKASKRKKNSAKSILYLYLW